MSAGGVKLTREDLRRLPEKINFPEEEERILSFWNKEEIFAKCMKASKGKPNYTFFDGPPFATGLPHYGHILAGTIKDVVTRYAFQQGYNVERRFGWDCHGLPVEYEIDKTLNIRGPEDVAKMGIKKYNEECRKIVMRYANEWEIIINRMGRWIDFKNDYKTLYPWYMESIWWVFKQLFEKGLVYQGNKVMPYSTACTTALSNFESGQNYKEVVDPCVVVAFETVAKAGEYFIIWTTTPWTLPSNFAVCVNPTMIYVKAKAKVDGKVYILAECRLSFVFKKESDYEILEKFPGSTLKDQKYKPVFNYFEKRGSEVGAFRVLVDGYVTQDSGTGIVHNAPYFGEDDYRVCMSAGIITKESEPICPLDDVGRFTSEVSDFAGQYIKDADKNIIANIKQKGQLFSVGQVKHNYPFCWRSDTPLVYRAVPSWFIRVEQMSENLLACSSGTYWVPENVKEKRFGNWLREARDWAVSRNRYWGTPIPLWKSDDNKEIICIGSIAELEALTGQKVTDLHRENIDHLTIPSARPGQPPLKRVKEVFDCWFESGSMPYAQQHFPFENEKDFLSNFPADFIAEGIDQTRGWFYTLLVLSTLLFNKPPFKNLIANGLVLAGDGQKMSKRKKNYPDPLEVVHKYGADALRLYLINSPVVRAENLRFKEEGVRDVIKDVFLPWYNAFRFLLQNVNRLEIEDKIQYTYDAERHMASLKDTSIMDTWILSFKESLLAFFDKEMKGYRLYTVVPRLTKFIDQLTNWYVRLNRRRLKGEDGKTECLKSLDTLYDVLFSMVKMMAPFTPFLADFIYKRLDLLNKAPSGLSVHLEMMPKSNNVLIHENIETAVSRMQSVIELGRIIRDRRTMPLKYPLTKVIVIHKDEGYLKDILSLKDFVRNELNILDIHVTTDKAMYGVTVRAEPNHKTLGIKLKGDFKAVMAAIKNLTNDEIEKSLAAGKFNILGHDCDLEDIRVIYCVSDKMSQQFEAHSDNDVLVLMDMTPNQELMEQGLAREIINRIQKLKKKAQLVPTDLVQIQYTVSPKSELATVAKKYKVMIESVVKSSFIEEAPKGWFEIINESYDLQGSDLKIAIYSEKQLAQSNNVPLVPWVNLVKSENLENRYVEGKLGTVLLQKSSGKIISFSELRSEVEKVFGLQDQGFLLKDDKGKIVPENQNVKELSGKIVLVSKNSADVLKIEGLNGSVPFVEFSNSENVTKLLENPKGVKLAQN